MNLYLPEPTAMLTKSEHRPSTLPYCLQSQPGAALAGEPHSCRGGHVQQQQPAAGWPKPWGIPASLSVARVTDPSLTSPCSGPAPD